MHHNSNNITEDSSEVFPLWNTTDLATAAINRANELEKYKKEGKTDNQIKTLVPSIGVKETPLWPFMPITRIVLPELHMLLGIGNKIQGHFWEFIHDRIEVMPIELLEAQNFKILCYIALERCQEEVDKIKIEVDEAKEN